MLNLDDFNKLIRIPILLMIMLASYPAISSFAQSPNEGEVEDMSNPDINEDIRKFCGSIVDVARDKRYLLQYEKLEQLQAKIDERIEIMQTVRDEYKDWLNKRNEFLATAEANLIEIYKKMNPDSAAQQLEVIDKNIAAAIIMKLNPRLSSLIFNEMNAETAATLATIIASTTNQPENGSQ